MSQASTALSRDERKQSTSTPSTVTVLDPLDRPIRGAKKIAEFLGLALHQAFYGLENGHYDATKRGRLWESTPRRLLGPPPAKNPVQAAE